MSHIRHDELRCVFSDNYNERSREKYKINQLERILTNCLNPESSTEELRVLCSALTYGYLNYLKLINPQKPINTTLLCVENLNDNWSVLHSIIVNLKQQLLLSSSLEEEYQLVTKLASVYYRYSSVYAESITLTRLREDKQHLVTQWALLIECDSPEKWLLLWIACCNNGDIIVKNLVGVLRKGDSENALSLLDFIFTEEMVHLFHTIFYYKIYPEQLFDQELPPEQLILIHTRLELLYQFIEKFLQDLIHYSNQYSSQFRVDYLLHGNEFPEGVTINFNENYREIIKSAVEQLAVSNIFRNETHIELELLHDLCKSCKYGFNANQLIDAVMVLQLRLVYEKIPSENSCTLFFQKMSFLFKQLSTSDSLDLYACLVSPDSCHFVVILENILLKNSPDWLPFLSVREFESIERVYYALKCIIEALGMELENRQIHTQPFIYHMAKYLKTTNARNQDAVLRFLKLYGNDTDIRSDRIEQFFERVDKL